MLQNTSNIIKTRISSIVKSLPNIKQSAKINESEIILLGLKDNTNKSIEAALNVLIHWLENGLNDKKIDPEAIIRILDKINTLLPNSFDKAYCYKLYEATAKIIELPKEILVNANLEKTAKLCKEIFSKLVVKFLNANFETVSGPLVLLAHSLSHDDKTEAIIGIILIVNCVVPRIAMLFFFDTLNTLTRPFDTTDAVDHISIKRRTKALLAITAEHCPEISRFLARMLPNGATAFWSEGLKQKSAEQNDCEERVDWNRVLTRLESDCEEIEFVWDDRGRTILKNFLESQISAYLTLKKNNKKYAYVSAGLFCDYSPINEAYCDGYYLRPLTQKIISKTLPPSQKLSIFEKITASAFLSLCGKACADQFINFIIALQNETMRTLSCAEISFAIYLMREHKTYNLSADRVGALMASILRAKANAVEFVQQRGVEGSAFDLDLFFGVVEALPVHGVDVRIMAKNSVFGADGEIWAEIDKMFFAASSDPDKKEMISQRLSLLRCLLDFGKRKNIATDIAEKGFFVTLMRLAFSIGATDDILWFFRRFEAEQCPDFNKTTTRDGSALKLFLPDPVVEFIKKESNSECGKLFDCDGSLETPIIVWTAEMRRHLKTHLQNHPSSADLKTPVRYAQTEALTAVNGIYVDLYNRSEGFALGDAHGLFTAAFEAAKAEKSQNIAGFGQNSRKETLLRCLDKILSENRAVLAKTADLRWIAAQIKEVGVDDAGVLGSALALLLAAIDGRKEANDSSAGGNGRKTREMAEFGVFCGILAEKAKALFNDNGGDSGEGNEEERAVKADFYIFECLIELYKAFPDKFEAELLGLATPLHRHFDSAPDPPAPTDLRTLTALADLLTALISASAPLRTAFLSADPPLPRSILRKMVRCRDTADEPQLLRCYLRPLAALLKKRTTSAAQKTNQNTENSENGRNNDKNSENAENNENNETGEKNKNGPGSDPAVQNLKTLRRALGAGLHRKIVAGEVFASWAELAQTRPDPFFFWDEARFQALKRFAELGGGEPVDERWDEGQLVVGGVYLGVLTAEHVDEGFCEKVGAEGFLGALVDRLARAAAEGDSAVAGEVARAVWVVLGRCERARAGDAVDRLFEKLSPAISAESDALRLNMILEMAETTDLRSVVESRVPVLLKDFKNSDDGLFGLYLDIFARIDFDRILPAATKTDILQLCLLKTLCYRIDGEAVQNKLRGLFAKHFASAEPKGQNSVYRYLPSEIAKAVLGETEFSCGRAFELFYGEVETPEMLWNEKSRKNIENSLVNAIENRQPFSLSVDKSQLLVGGIYVEIFNKNDHFTIESKGFLPALVAAIKSETAFLRSKLKLKSIDDLNQKHVRHAEKNLAELWKAVVKVHQQHPDWFEAETNVRPFVSRQIRTDLPPELDSAVINAFLAIFSLKTDVFVFLALLFNRIKSESDERVQRLVFCLETDCFEINVLAAEIGFLLGEIVLRKNGVSESLKASAQSICAKLAQKIPSDCNWFDATEKTAKKGLKIDKKIRNLLKQSDVSEAVIILK